LIFAFVGPVALVLVLNIVFFVRTSAAIWRMSVRKQVTADSDLRLKTKRALVAAASFFSGSFVSFYLCVCFWLSLQNVPVASL
jgi:hypothetical protein